ncbi:hypothetical protein [Acidiluteibacter ferrifornacis]|uniref:Uncharacterized protein n=1 Tax=Acidiluteibacter ferrifornacis TaxID=2692424 RepID=A0A6N9NK45_9FLAO|nr:hypothetical protein [Acidiluteibacter ferrifornacis]NBG66293.1 hypothetical protein [Acidiluteibacter ferrifornacis]
MYRKDQLKGIVAIILFGLIGISFFIFGDESTITRYVAIISFAIWLISIYFINKKFEKKD